MLFLMSLIVGNFLSSQVGVANMDGITGTAVKISPNIYLTAAHVADYPVPSFIMCPEKAARIIDIRLSTRQDMAILVTDEDCDVEAAVVSEVDPKVGDDILVRGCPAGICGMVTKGVVSNFIKSGPNEFMLSDAQVWFGNSGGPVYADGKLVGIVHGIRCLGSDTQPKACYTYIVPVSYIREFLKS